MTVPSISVIGCRTATASAFTPLPPRSTYLLPFRCGRNCRNFVLFWTPISAGWRYLRMLGFDVLYRTHCDDEELAHTSAAEHRILLTRDQGLLKRGEVIWGYFVRAA